MSYVPLHNHSEFSFFDGYSTPEEMAVRAKEIGAPAIAITDHGNVNGLVKFAKACKKHGVKPILGMEAYWVKDLRQEDEKSDERYHLVLWAATEEGYRNLLKIASIAATEGYRKKYNMEFQRIDDSVLEKYGKGIIASSACLSGRIPRLLLQNRMDEAIELANYYKSIFDHFVLEIQPQEIPEQYIVNARILELAERTGLPVIVTTDSHYSCQSDAPYQDVLIAIQDKRSMDDPERFRMSGGDLYWIKDAETIINTLKIDVNGKIEVAPRDIVELALKNTLWVNDQITFEIQLGGNKFPHFPIDTDETEEELFRRKAEEGLFSWLLQNEITDVETYQERLKSELDVIAGKGYSGYFLIVSDIVQWGKDKGFPFGPGRGSAGGCLTSSVLNITQMDPVKHDLIFERFLNPARPSPPDIDIDVANDKRAELIEYVKQKYGHDRVAQIANATTMAAKDALKRVAKAYGIPHAEINQITKLITADKIEEETNPTVVEFLSKHPHIRDAAIKLQNRVIGRGIHAAGIVIAPGPITDYVAVQLGEDGEIVTQADKQDIEDLGLLKIDLLGLKTLKVLDHAIRLANDPNFTWETLWNMDYEDPAIYKVLNSGRTESVFQVESDLMKGIIKEVKPSRFSDIVAILSLGRPGPMQMIPTYAARKHKRQPVQYLHPKLEPILRDTYGIFVYQEQVIRAATDLAGYSLEEADLLRRGIGKKDHEVMNAEHERFVRGCQEVSGIPKEIAEQIWDQIVAFADYGFNKSHAVGYAMITCWTAYTKYHKPAEFWTAVLSNEVESNSKDRDKKILLYAMEAKKDGVKFLCPDINLSDYWFTLEGKSIRWGLSGIKGLGPKAAEALMAMRPIESLDDLLTRADTRILNKTRLKVLALVGALDNLPDTMGMTRNEIWNAICDWRRARKNKVDEEEYIKTWSKVDQIRFEQEILGIAISYQSTWSKTKDGQDITVRGEIKSVREHIDRNKNTMAFATIETEEGDKIDCVCFASVYKKVKSRLKVGKTVIIDGRKQNSSLIINDIRKDSGQSPVEDDGVIVNFDAIIPAVAV